MKTGTYNAICNTLDVRLSVPVNFLHIRLGFLLFRLINPIPTCGKDKKRTTANGPKAGSKSIRDLIVMLK